MNLRSANMERASYIINLLKLINIYNELDIYLLPKKIYFSTLIIILNKK
ncbi:hypothetical protein SacN8_09070 [Sulfolobus acidocaldarius N8]|uniref:Uncharacterized protein n=2 Tax=Sulfolobus acidocaldarius TaxID=2285 RepID=M1J053_9CREN|nr:hypothetical protein SacN8_09070 [Sulfolobus acidocaldarius N8]AGE74047.1 hypothetical protein SacRon12I_09090 [Sulfolobus acidocaldarius Ron12/I]